MSELVAWYNEPRAQPRRSAWDGRIRVGAPQHTRILLQDLTRNWKGKKVAEFEVFAAKCRAEGRIAALEDILGFFSENTVDTEVQKVILGLLIAEKEEYQAKYA